MRGAVHMQVTTIGLDIAKNVFQVHGIDSSEKVVVRKRLRRGQVLAFFKALPPCEGLRHVATQLRRVVRPARPDHENKS
jgi:transposase